MRSRRSRSAFWTATRNRSCSYKDNPTSGSMFTHDKLTWKIRHIYGGNVLDYRGMYGAIVA